MHSVFRYYCDHMCIYYIRIFIDNVDVQNEEFHFLRSHATCTHGIVPVKRVGAARSTCLIRPNRRHKIVFGARSMQLFVFL